MKVEQKEIEIRRERIRKQQIDWKSQERIRREEAFILGTYRGLGWVACH